MAGFSFKFVNDILLYEDMKWFAGSVSTAIQVSRKNKALFVVFIESKNGKGERMRELWDKLWGKDWRQEGDPTPVVPASYIIDNVGKPLEVITLLKDLDFDEFFSKIHSCVKVFCASTKSIPNSDADSSLSEPLPVASTSTSLSSCGANLLEERIQKAKTLLEQKKACEEIKKQEEEKKQELERIDSGKLLQEAQKKRQEQELIEAAAQRRRDKIEAERERERLKAQIKADREEREFRERLGKNIAKETPEMQDVTSKMEPITSDQCRVQVRLPNGGRIVEDFSSNDCLLKLVEIVKQDGRINGSFSVAQVFPRKVFTENELQKSFTDLSLTPTCTLLIIQSQSNIIPKKTFGDIFALFSFVILLPLRYIYNVVSIFVGRRSDKNLPAQIEANKVKREREPHSTGATIRRRGNTSRLHNTNDDTDEENANWNGNSTQFL
ncbi:UBX domain protein [Dictyocaulus viviparus]|uniref:UBX domain-containing protein 4 n=1 Tax=Dictyocaulus viviparus TaxID=29172 RepID=A0A0D8XJ62_DICVI|nr:UBX domain protein [Dictyocaulus viviparus]